MPLSLLTPPAAEPVTLADMKAYLRVEHADEDALIMQLIASARAACEAATRRALITQVWRLTRERWPRAGQIDVLLAPLIAVVAARIVAADGTSMAIDAARFKVVAGAAPGLILVRQPLPQPNAGGAIELDVEAGFGNSAAQVPADLIEAVRRLAAQFYEQRGAGDEKSAALPPPVAALLKPYRMVSL